MNSTGACRFAVAYASFGLLAVMLLGTEKCLAAECGLDLNGTQKVARFKQLDGEAENAMHTRRFSDAVNLYEQAVCLVPDSARGEYGLGMAEAAAGDFRRAREALKTSDRLQPNTPIPLIMQVRVNFSLGDTEALKENLRESAIRFPNDRVAHQALSRFLAEKNLLLLALAEALRSEQASGGNPSGGEPDSKLQVAILENTVGAYGDAVRNASQVEQDKGLGDGIRAAAAGVAGLSNESLGRIDEAVRLLKESIALDPSRDNSYLALADLFDQAKKYGDAVKVLKQGRAGTGDSPAVLLALGTDLVHAEQLSEATRLLRDLAQRYPDSVEVYVSLADAARRAGNPVQEIEALKSLERHRPNYPTIHVLLARAILSAQPADYAEALDELSLAEKETPADPDVFYLRGKAYVAMARYEEALLPLHRSVELRAMDPGPYYQLARAYQKLGQSNLAREQFERVKSIESAASTP